MAQIALSINGKEHNVQVSEDIPLLWVIREHLQLSGTKFGCGISQCGACTVHVDGKPMRSCQLRVSRVVGRKITTIEGIAEDHPVKKAWINIQVPQCGYCQSGQIMSAVALVEENSDPSEEEIIQAMDGNLCRCGTYTRIKQAIVQAAQEVRNS
ncbi:MAG: (2Fe-2S)-binding protein [Acidobacteriota bacterium]|jgi:aerobic-type carbon monoxide dehydrogenase small subunit (CoxS/CutS family)|nr:(2Fe-2S)-binding protein [Acidobacteriota bacterium]